MDNSLRTVVEGQVRRVRRRLLIQTALENMALSLAGALLVSAVWLVVFPVLPIDADPVWRWVVPIGVVLLGVGAGIFVGCLRTPDVVSAALALDERFALKERVTTLLTLPPEYAGSPAGQALLNDVAPRVQKLHVTDRFPLAISWRWGLIPALAMVLAILACFVDVRGLRFPIASAATPVAETKVDSQKIEDQLEKLRKAAEERKAENGDQSKEMKELLDEWDKLVSKPLDPTNAEQVRERIAEMRTLEQKMKEHAHQLKAEAQKNDAFKKLLERLGEDGKKLKEGPAKDFEDAMVKGDFHKAKEILDKLAKQIQENKLTPQQRQELQEQFKQLQDKVKRLGEKDERRKQIEKDFQEGRIPKEERDRLMKETQKELQELANLLGECKECLNDEAGNAADGLSKLAKKFEEMDLTEQELGDILRQMEELNDAALGFGDGIDDGDGEGMDGPGGGPPGRKRRANPDDPDSKIVNQRQAARVDPTSQQRITGFTQGGNFNKIPASKTEGAFRQAAQDGPEAIERQNIPEDAADIARGYFKRLGGQK
jgi:hypothetical protein